MLNEAVAILLPVMDSFGSLPPETANLSNWELILLVLFELGVSVLHYFITF